MREKFSIRRFAMVHRLGRLEIGETSVLIAVCAAIAPLRSTPAGSASIR